MSKFIRGDLLIFTKRGLVRMDMIMKEDLIMTVDKDGNYHYEEIEELTKTFKKNYKLNKLKIGNYYDNYFINDNVNIRVVQNIPNEISSKDIPKYLNDNRNRCLIKSSMGDISDFDYIGFPLNLSMNNLSEFKSDNNDFYRFQGLILTNDLRFNNEYDKNTIDFLENYMKINNISYEIIKDKDNRYSVFEINYQTRLDMNDIFLMNKDELMEFLNGIIENSNEFDVNNNDIYKIIKFTCILLGSAFTSYFKDGKTHIKILKEDKNNFIYDNMIWNKIKSIKKVDYNGNLYSLKFKSNNPFLSEMGIIS